MKQDTLPELKNALLDCASNFDSSQLFPTVVPEAYPLVVSDPYAFAIAICLDRGVRAQIIWTIPFDMKNQLGHLDPRIIYQMELPELAALFSQLPRKPRFVNDAPRTVSELTRIVVEEHEGDASKIWAGKSASQVKRTFQSIHGVGNQIANMAVLLIEAAFPVHFDDLDRPQMDIKADVHTMRVLYRLGIADNVSEWAAVEAARQISPEYPGVIDGALWWIGRTWCFPNNPNCPDCCMNALCAKKFD